VNCRNISPFARRLLRLFLPEGQPLTKYWMKN
jgi:hypothetical protein